MSINVYSQKAGHVVETDFESVSLASPLTWVRVVNPSKDELERINKLTGIEPDVFEDCLDESERSRVESGEYVLIIYKAPYYEEDDIVTIPVGFIIKKNIVITVCKRHVKSVEYLAKLIGYNKGKFLFKYGVAGLIFNVIDKINEEYLNVINRVGDTSDLIEEEIFELKRENVERILSINTTLAYFHSAFSANLEVLKILRKGYIKYFREHIEDFDDLYIDVTELIDSEKIQRDIINNIFNMQSTIVSNELNQVVRKITSIAAIIAIPTLISSIYGMNFEYMPLAHDPYGFYVVMVAMIVTVAVLAWNFRRLKWL